MILKKAPTIYKNGDHKSVIKFAFIPTQLKEICRMDPTTFEVLPNIIGELIWLERYVETYRFAASKTHEWIFVKSERYETAFLNKLCT